jgi:hypothetical protein
VRAEAPAANDVAELGLRVRVADERDAASIANAGLSPRDTSVRVVNVVAGHARGFERGDLIVATCEGAPVIYGDQSCLLVVRDGAVVRL